MAKRKPNRHKGMFSGAKLRACRVAADLTQGELAARAEVHPIDISRYERDMVEPSISVAVVLARVLGVELKDFLRDDPHEQNAEQTDASEGE